MGDRGHPHRLPQLRRAFLAPDEADDAILESLERFRAHGALGSWHVGPSMRPADTGERLLAHGFTYGGDDIGMAVDLTALPEEVPVVERGPDKPAL